MTATNLRPSDPDWKAEAAYDPEPPRGDTYHRAGVTVHIYDQHRCIFCNVNDLDNDIYGPFPCLDREPYTYTTETGDPSVLDKDETDRDTW